MIGTLAQSLHHENVKAFLRVIRAGESSQGDEAYWWLFGSTHSKAILAESLKDHPRVKTYEKYDGQFIKNGKLDYTTAAGAYQITASTWDTVIQPALKLGDFSPTSQDIAAVFLIQKRGALDDVIDGRVKEACAKLTKEWASMPGASYGDQPTRKLEQALATFKEYGGTLNTDKGNVGSIDGSKENVEELTEIPHIPAGEVLPDQPSKPMAPIIAALLPSLVEAIPKLGQIFAKSDVSQRNVKAAEIAFSVAKEALGATNEQEVVQRVQADPAAAQAVAKAVEASWYVITQEVGGGISAARDADAKFTANGERGFWHSPAFWISVGLLGMPVGLVLDFLFFHPGNYDSNLRTQIVTALLGVITVVAGYWIGTSASSQRKTELMNK